MQSNSIVQSVENASIANTVLVVPSDRSFSSTPTVTAPTTTTTTTAADLTALVVDRAVGSAPSPFLVSSDVFPGHLPHPPPLLPLTTVSVHRRRAFSKSGMPAIVKRSASTPNVRGVAADMAALSYAADKRRNKLGYHRTSVACGHCRRRKIRCLLAPDDPQGRCSNCIRLKKDCNFFPVDQQPPSEAQKHPGMKDERHSTGHSSSSSPSPSNPHRASKSHITNFHQYQSASIGPGSQPFTTPVDGPSRNGSVSSMNKHAVLMSSASSARPSLPHMQTTPPVPGPVDYARAERSSGWEGSPYLEQSPLSNGSRPVLEDPSTSFWRLTESPMTPAFSSFAAPPGVPAIHHRESVSAYPYAVHREDPGWPLQSRSMSFGQLEGLSMNQSGHYPAMHDYKHPPPAHPYASNYSTAHPPIPPMVEPASAPPDGRVPNGSFGMPPPWNPSFTGGSMGGMSGKGAEAFGGWYQEPGRLAQVAEEVHTGPLNEEAPTYYHGTAQSTA